MDIPAGLNSGDSKLLQSRRKKAIRIMSEMSVLEVAKGKMKE